MPTMHLSLSLAVSGEGARHSGRPPLLMYSVCLTVSQTLVWVLCLLHSLTCLSNPPLPSASTPTLPVPLLHPTTPDRFPSGLSRSLASTLLFQLSLLHPSLFLAASCCCLYFPPVHPSPLLLSPFAFIPSHPHLIYVYYFSPNHLLSTYHLCLSPQMKMLVMSMALSLEETETELREDVSGCDEA